MSAPYARWMSWRRPSTLLNRPGALWTGLGFGIAYLIACAYASPTVQSAGQAALFWPAAGVALGGALRYGLRVVWVIPVVLALLHATIAPVPWMLSAFTYPYGEGDGEATAGIRAYLFSPDAVDYVRREEPAWEAWLQGLFVPA